MSFNKKQAYSDNYNAIYAIFDYIRNNKPIDAEILAKYKGYGGLKEILLDANAEDWKGASGAYREDVVKLHTLIRSFYKDKPASYASMMASLKSSTLTSYYTDAELVNAMLSPLAEIIGNSPKILDPSCGNGAYFGSIRKTFNNAIIKGVEKEGFVATLVQILHRDSKIYKEGFESAAKNFSNDSFDLITSNIPFGDYSVFDKDFANSKDKRLKYSQNRIHNYFFAKSTVLAKPGGFIAFITSTGVMDSKSSAFLREKLMEDCHLISAVRLPDTAFKDSSGTEVNSDIILLRKRIEPLLDKEMWSENERKFLDTVALDGFEYSINSLYQQQPERLLGKYEVGYIHNRETAVLRGLEEYNSVSFLSLGITKILNEDISSLGILRFNEKSESQGLLFSIDDIEKKIFVGKDLVEHNCLVPGSIFSLNGVNGTIQLNSEGMHLKPFESPAINAMVDLEGRIKAIVSLKKAYKELIVLDSGNNIPNAEKAREWLNNQYDQFVLFYGKLNTKQNLLLLENDFEGVVIKSLENDGLKSEIFFKSTQKIENAVINNVADAAFNSLNTYGKVNIDYMSSLLGLSANEVINQGIIENVLFPKPVFDNNFNYINPTKEDYANLIVEYVTKDEFISGPVSYVHSWMEQYAKQYYPQDSEEKISADLRALSDVMPPLLSIEMISPNLGEEWIRPKIYESFAEELFDVSCKVSKLESLNSWNFKMSSRSTKADNAYKVTGLSGRSLYAEDLFINAMNNTYPIMKYSVDDKMYIDRQATAIARDKIDEINTAFKTFLIKQKDLSDELVIKYNALYNRNVKRKFDGSHLSFPGLDYTVFQPHPHQKDAVWQLVQNGGGICDHEVGSGKSLVIAMASMEKKRLGLVNKPMAIGLKANTQELYADFLRAYPKAKVLCPNENDFTPDKRNLLIQKIANNNWDCVILTHDQFGFIEQSPDIQEKIINDEIVNIERDLKELIQEDKPSARQLKGLEKRKLNLEASLLELQESMKKDENVLPFDKLGVDHLFIDESQQFKNLSFTTRHNRVAGLGDPEGSQKAMNLLVACRSLQQRHSADAGITFLSGTTISNSMVEMYSLLKYLRPEKLESMGLSNFDSWARTFAEMSTDFELNVVNEVSPKSRFRAFVKVPELAALYTEIAHVVNGSNSTVDKPKTNNIMVEIEPTREQIIFTENLVDAIKSNNFSFLGKHFTESQLNAKMLIATNYSAKSSLDMRLVSPDLYDITSGSKIPELSRNAYKEYTSSDSFKGTQLIFCDTGVPETELAKTYVSIYHEIKNELVSFGVKAEEIAFIHDYKTGKRRKELFKKINCGEIRFAIGSTTKMGVGVNVQQRVVAMHHLDLCWRPSDMEQREGRGARQKNIFAKSERGNVVNNYVYCTARSLDGYKYYLLDLKRKFINQIKDGSVTARRIEEGDISGDGDMSPAAFIARLSGKQEVLEKSRLEKKLNSAIQKKDSILSEVTRLNSLIDRGLLSLSKKEVILAALKNDLMLRDELFKSGENNSIKFKMKVGANSFTDFKAAGEAILYNFSKIKEKDKTGPIVLASVGNFKLSVEFEKSLVKDSKLFESKDSYSCSVSREGSIIQYQHGTTLSDVPGNAGRYIYDCLGKIGRLIRNTENDIEQTKKEVSVAKDYLPQLDGNKYDAEISELRIKVRELENKLNADLEPTADKIEEGKGEKKVIIHNKIIKPKEKGNSISIN